MCVNNLPKVATQWNSAATRDSNRGRRVLIPSALTTAPASHVHRLSRLPWLELIHDLHDLRDLFCCRRTSTFLAHK